MSSDAARTLRAVDAEAADEFRSVNRYLGQITPDELRILHEQLTELAELPAFKSLAALLRLDREQHLRMMLKKGQDHADLAWEAGYVRGAATTWAVFETVHGTHKRVQSALPKSMENGE